jgi:hypothetical protein
MLVIRRRRIGGDGDEDVDEEKEDVDPHKLEKLTR